MLHVGNKIKALAQRASQVSVTTGDWLAADATARTLPSRFGGASLGEQSGYYRNSEGAADVPLGRGRYRVVEGSMTSGMSMRAGQQTGAGPVR